MYTSCGANPNGRFQSKAAQGQTKSKFTNAWLIFLGYIVVFCSFISNTDLSSFFSSIPEYHSCSTFLTLFSLCTQELVFKKLLGLRRRKNGNGLVMLSEWKKHLGHPQINLSLVYSSRSSGPVLQIVSQAFQRY